MTYHLLSWGANSHGQLGQGIRSEECLRPCEIHLSGCFLNPQNIRKIVGGAGHTLILCNDGSIYSCGWNNKGQLGIPGTEEVLSFRQIQGQLKNKVIVDVDCGWDSSSALAIDGTLYLWGSNYFGQLGKESASLRWTHEPLQLLTDKRIDRVAMGLRHTVFVTEDRKIYISSSSSKKQSDISFPQAEGNYFNDAFTFAEVSVLSNVKDIVCGQRHTIALTMDGEIYVLGDNKHGQLGIDPKVVLKSPIPMKLTDTRFDSALKLQSGWSHVIALNDGHVFSWGRNTYGQLGCSENQRPQTWKIAKIEGLPKIRQISSGSEHNVALTEDGRIFSWGWNEHGNCGNGQTTDVSFPEKLSLPVDCIGILVGSGAGHSLAVVKKS